MRVSILGSMTVAAAAIAMSSCTDSRGLVTPSNPGSTRLIAGPTRMDVVTRDVPLTAPVSASAQIGVLGGQIAIPEVGLTVTVPAFAVTATTTITVTAVPGSLIAYEFEPHGLTFKAPLAVTQSLAATSADKNGLVPGVLYGGYFPDASSLDQIGGTAAVDEILRVSIDRFLGQATFSVLHFSGYLLATGESSPGDGGGLH